MTQLTHIGPVRAALALIPAAAVIALLGAGSAWAMTAPAAPVARGPLAAGPSAPHGIIPVNADEAAYPAKYDKAREEMRKGEMEVQQGIADEQKGAAEIDQGLADEEKAMEEMEDNKSE